MNVLSFGEILWDVYPDKKLIGGAPFNFASHLAKHSENVYFLSSVGNDALGNEALLALNTMGVFGDYVAVLNDKPTGQCLVTLDENAIPTYDLKSDVAYDYISAENVDKDFDLLYFGTLALRNRYNLDSLKKLLTRQSFKDVFVDVNIREPYFNFETVDFALSNATILKVSDEELPTIAELASIDKNGSLVRISYLLKQKYKNLKIIIITLGDDGAFCNDFRYDKTYICPAKKVNVASTVGAGDSFCAAFVYQLYKGEDIWYCLEYAAKVAGYVVSKFDAVPEYDFKDFIK